MNDEFLHALRREPPPEFARALKRRLQRLPARRSPRSAFGRTLLAMFLIGGVAMAAALLWRGRDERPREEAPLAQAVAPKPAPLTPQPAASPQSGRQVGGTSPAASGPQAEEKAVEPLTSTFAATSLTRPLAEELVYGVRTIPKAPRVAVMDEAEALRALCGNAHFAIVSRRITEAELTKCWSQGIEIAEWKLGYQAVVLTAGPMAQPAALKPREVFLALARRIPDPADPSQLIDNPNTTWRDVDPRFDFRTIDVLLPTDAVTRTAFLQLLMEPGCETYRWIHDLKRSNRRLYDDICHQLRSDDRIHDAQLGITLVTQRLWAEPNWLVVLNFSYYESYRSELLGTMLEGPVPSRATLADGTYEQARPVYVYAQRLRTLTSVANRALAYQLTDTFMIGTRGSLARVGLVPVDEPPTTEILQRKEPAR